jgi:hypothetical protein
MDGLGPSPAKCLIELRDSSEQKATTERHCRLVMGTPRPLIGTVTGRPPLGGSGTERAS